jgi:hydroxypyruvate reductase
LDRPPQDQLTALAALRADVAAIAEAALAGVSPRVLVPAALAGVAADTVADGTPLHVIAVGKAAAGMFSAFADAVPGRVADALAIGPVRPPRWRGARWVSGGHPLPTDGSIEAGRAALALAARVPSTGRLLLLLSGGASALMAVPAPGLSLAAKGRTTQILLAAGAAISELNAVRKHLSAVKGGRLAAACPSPTVTLALSDVVGDELSVIGSGPGVPDNSTWADARAVLRAFGGDAAHDPDVLAYVERGCAGERPETPKSGDAAMRRARAHVIGGRAEAMRAAAAAARERGYDAHVVDAAVTGEARDAAAQWWRAHGAPLVAAGRRLALVSSGETTVRVRGSGRGGRNQEFALALVPHLAMATTPCVIASIGTDGIDGPTDAAGAVVDPTTARRAAGDGLVAAAYLDRNDSHAFFAALGDLLQPGPTGTNVGDLQVLLTAPA